MAEHRIVTVTLNPAVDRVFDAPGFGVGKTVRGKRKALFPAGKGVNVSRALAALGGRSVATGFVGAGELSMFENHLERAGAGRAVCQFLIVRARTRDNITVIDPINETETHVLDEGFVVQPDDVARISSKLAMLANDNAVIVFAGSLPPGVTPEAFRAMAARCRDLEAKVVLDTSGDALVAMQDEPVWLAKLNEEELATFTGADVSTAEGAYRAARALAVDGGGRIEHVIATRGAEGAIYIGGGQAVQGRVSVHPGRVLTTIGCGDALLAGVLSAWTGAGDWSEALREGLAVATANAVVEEAGALRVDDIEEFRQMAMIEPVERSETAQ